MKETIYNILIEFPRRNASIEKDCAAHIAKIMEQERDKFAVNFAAWVMGMGPNEGNMANLKNTLEQFKATL